MKISSFCLTLFVLPLSSLSWADEGDFNVNFSVNEISQPVTFESSRQTLSAINTGVQFTYNQENWATGISVNHASNDLTEDVNKHTEQASLEQTGKEIYYSYYWQDWSFSLSYGQHDLLYEVTKTLPLPNKNRHLISAINKQYYESGESYFIAGISRWIDLSNFVNQMALTPSAGVSLVNSTGQQGSQSSIEVTAYDQQVTTYLEGQGITPGIQRQNSYTLKDQQLVYDVGVSLDYMPPYFSDLWFFSLWMNHEFVSSSDGVISTRLGNGKRVIQREFPLDEEGVSLIGTSVTSYGISAEYSFNDDFAVTYGWYDSDVSERQWNFSLSYFY